MRKNVRDGIISKKKAEELFGVILSDDFDPVVDMEGTKLLREKLKAQKYIVVQPVQPASGTWRQETMTEDDEYVLNPTV